RPQHHFRTDRLGRAAVPDREVEAAMVRFDTGTPGSRRPDGHGTTMAITTPISSESQLDAALAALARAPLESLRESWAGRYGRLPPRSLNRRPLADAPPHYIQARIYGGHD